MIVDIEHLKEKCLPRRRTLDELGIFWDQHFAGKDFENMAEAERAFRERARELENRRAIEQAIGA